MAFRNVEAQLKELARSLAHLREELDEGSEQTVRTEKSLEDLRRHLLELRAEWDQPAGDTAAVPGPEA